MHSSSAGLKPRDRSLCPFFHQISRQPSRFSMRRVVGEEVSLSMPASVNDNKCEGDSSSGSTEVLGKIVVVRDVSITSFDEKLQHQSTFLEPTQNV